MDLDGLCLCGCGQQVQPGRSWLRGHAARGQGGFRGTAAGPAAGPAPIPGPDDPSWTEDVGIIDVGDLVPDPGGDETPGPGPGSRSPGPGLPPPRADDGPAHARRDWHARDKTPKGRPPKVTASVRSDIEAKIGFGLTIPAHMWQARDPWCGGAFVQQLPAIAATLTSWVCRSSALVEWFTSPAGSGFVLLLDSAAAFGPVFSAVMAHHVYHTAGDEPPADSLQPDYGRYAA